MAGRPPCLAVALAVPSQESKTRGATGVSERRPVEALEILFFAVNDKHIDSINESISENVNNCCQIDVI